MYFYYRNLVLYYSYPNQLLISYYFYLSRMGNQNQSISNAQNQKKSAQKKDFNKNIYEQGYKQAYLQLKNHPNFYDQFLHQCPMFGKNLRKLFPMALNTPEQYFQMVTYLRKYDPAIKQNKQAEQNSRESTLLDRFFMICLGNLSFKEFKKKTLSKQQIQVLLLDYFHLFQHDPKGGFLTKAVKFIQMQEQFKAQEMISVRVFSQKFRQHFPHVQKYLKDYYYAKFLLVKKEYRILKHFDSKILKGDAIILALKLPEVTGTQVTQLYNSEEFGISFHTIEKKLVGYTGPWLLLIEHNEKDPEGQRQTYIFGTYQNGPVKNLGVFQGDITGFMFTIEPNLRFMTTDRGNGGQNYFLINGADEKITKRRRGIGFGGTNQMENFKLWIDEDMDKSKVFSGNDPTYGYGTLTGLATSTLNIKRMEIWGLGNKQNLQAQKQYWQQRYQEIMKIRKVDKKQFFDQSSSIFFQKTLEHRDQVYGQIQRSQKKQETKQ